MYEKMVQQVNNEFEILLDLSAEKLRQISQPMIAEAMLKARKGDVKIKPGFDGQYGQVKILSPHERQRQKSLFE